MAMGKPVVAPRLAPVEEGIIDGKVGLLFQKQDKAAMASAIMTLLQDKAKRLRMGEAAREHVLNNTWKKNAERVIALWRSARQSKGG
jgi:glycosyltransferase involved in cell wall biosynthesis